MSETHHVVLAGAPLGQFGAELAAAAARAGAVGLMDIARPRDVVAPVGVPAPGRDVIAEVISLPDARRAVADGAVGLVARGIECGDRGGAESAFILLQRMLDADLGVPVWAAGGIGPHSAAAAVAGAAQGVLLDTQLALFPKSPLSAADRDRVRRAANNATGPGGPDPAVRAGQDLLLALDLSARYRHADELLAAVLRRVERVVTDVGGRCSSLVRVVMRPKSSVRPLCVAMVLPIV